MKPARGDSARLQGVLDTIEVIERHSVADHAAFDADEFERG